MLRIAALISVLLLGACAGTGGTVELGRFQAADGQPLVLSRSTSANTYYLIAPGSVYGPLQVRRMEGLSDVVMQRALVADGRAIVLVRGSTRSCANRYLVLTNRLPLTGTAYVPGCKKTYELVQQPNGRDVTLRQTGSPAPVYFVFHNDTLYGPAQMPRLATRARPGAPGPQPKVQPASAAHARPLESPAGAERVNDFETAGFGI